MNTFCSVVKKPFDEYRGIVLVSLVGAFEKAGKHRERDVVCFLMDEGKTCGGT